MKPKLLSLFAACALLLPLACDNAEVNDPSLNPSFAAGGGYTLRDTDTNTAMPADTTVPLGDVINMALYAGNGGLQNNKNVVWTNSNPVAVSLVPNKGSAIAVAQALGTSTVCAALGSNSSCVVITVSAGPGAAYVVTSTSYAVAAGASVTISAQLVDASNNPAPEAGRIVTWSSTNGGSFLPATSVTNSSGVATTTFTVSTVAGTTHVVTATDNLAASGSSAPIIVQPGAAVNMVAYAGQGQSATVGTAVAIPPAVRVTDAFNNPVSGVVVNFAVTSGGGSASGTLQTTDANGVAAVGSWTVGNTPGTNTLDAISAGLPTVTFTATATVGGATQLAMQTQPSSTAQAGVQFAQQPAVQLKDALNNDVATAGVVVTASIATGAGTLAGTLSATTDGTGLASFTDLRIDGATGTRTLRFQASGVSDAISDAVNVVAGPAHHLAMVTQPSSTAQAGVQFAQQPSVRLEDQFNNAVQQSGVQVDAAIASGGGTLLGVTSVNTDANGVASYTDLAIAGTVGPRTLSFSATGVTSATSNTINVGAGPVADILLTTPSTTVPVNTTITITGQLRDQYGNNVPQVASVTWSSTNGGSFSANPTNTDGTGQTSVDFTVSNTANVTHAVTATAGSANGTINITTVNTAPIGNDDTFDAIGNVTIPVPAPGVLANDTDAEQPVSAVAGTITTTNGGTVQMNADGSFTYLSAAGFTGTDSFTYTTTDGSDTDVAQVTMIVPTRVWYAKNDATAPGDGRDASPFVLLKNAELASAVGETVLVFYGNGTVTNYDQGFVFKNSQSLIGQGIPADLTQTVNGVPVVLLPAGNAPKVTRATAGNTMQLASNNTLRGFEISSTAGATINGSAVGSFSADNNSVLANGGAGLSLTTSGTANASFSSLSASGGTYGILLSGIAGTVTAAAGTISGTSAAGIEMVTGTATLSYGGDITAAAGRVLFATGNTGGGATLSGNLSTAALGIRVIGNTNASYTFSGASKTLAPLLLQPGVEVLNNTATPVRFTNGGLVITSTNAIAFNAAANTGASDLTVSGAANSISSTNGSGLVVENTPISATGLTFQSISANGGANGIALTNTGTAGGLTVTGTGTAGSGGIIQGQSGGDNLQAGNGIWLASTRNVSLKDMQLNTFSNHAIRGFDVDGFTLDTSVVNGISGTSAVALEGSLSFTNLTGTVQIRNSMIAGGFTDNIRISNTTGALALTLVGTTVQGNPGINADNGLNLLVQGTASATISVTGNTFSANRGDHIDLRGSGAAAINATISGNTFTGGHPSAVGQGITLTTNGPFNGTYTYDVDGNMINGSIATAVTALLGPTGPSGLMQGRIRNNLIGTTGTPSSGSLQGHCLDVEVTGAGTGTHTTSITGNTIRECFDRGMELIGNRDGNNTFNVTVSGNDVNGLGGPSSRQALNLETGSAAGTETGTVCADIRANTFVALTNGDEMRVRQRSGTTLRMPNYLGGAANDADVIAYLQARNPAGGTAVVIHAAPAPFQNTVPAGSNCPM